MITSEYIKTHFFSKENIISINKRLFEKKKFTNNMIKDDKKEIVTIIIENMKIIYKNLSIDKINENNYSSIFDQFNNHSLEESINDINKLHKFNKYILSDSNVRDFSICKKVNTNMIDRPFSSKINEEFNNTINNIKNNREADLGFEKKPTDLPDILKPISTSVKKEEVHENKNTADTNLEKNNGMVDTKQNQFFKLDNFSKPLISPNVVVNDDNKSFDERLKMLKQSREI